MTQDIANDGLINLHPSRGTGRLKTPAQSNRGDFDEDTGINTMGIIVWFEAKTAPKENGGKYASSMWPSNSLILGQL
jgi:hypothetical protein